MTRVDINLEVQHIFELQAKESILVDQLEEVRTKLEESMKALSRRIQGGATTGDLVRDFVAVRHWCPNEEIEEIYRDLEKRVAEHINEFVLVVSRWEQPANEMRIFSHLSEDVELGVLKATKLVFGVQCYIPTGNYVSFRKKNMARTMSLLDGHLPAGRFHDFTYLNKPLESMPLLMQLEVRVGNKEVEEWFVQRGGEDYEDYAVAFYKAATRLLGREFGEAEFPKLATELQLRREAVADRLAEIVREHAHLQKSTCFPNLKSLRDKIREQLEVALDLGMRDMQLLWDPLSPSILQLCKEYGVKTL